MTEAKSQTMRHTMLSVIMYLPSVLAFCAATRSSATEEPFGRSTSPTGRALAAGAETERPNPRNTTAETAKRQDPFASERMTTTTTPSRRRLSERSGVTGVAEFRGRAAESNPWKELTETPYATSGQGTIREAAAGNAETAVGRRKGPETSGVRADPGATADPSPAPATRSSTEWDERSAAPANHSAAVPLASSTVEPRGSTRTGSRASADTRRTPTAYDTATEARDRDLGRSAQTDNKTELRSPQGNSTSGGESQPKCGKGEAKRVPPSKSAKLVCFVTLWTLGVTASVFFGLTVFFWVRLSVHREKERQRKERWTWAGGERSTLWAQPKGTLEQRVEFWYANGPSVAPEQAAVRARPPEDAARRREPETLWTPPRVTLEDITEFWYSNGRTRPHIERSEV